MLFDILNFLVLSMLIQNIWDRLFFFLVYFCSAVAMFWPFLQFTLNATVSWTQNVTIRVMDMNLSESCDIRAPFLHLRSWIALSLKVCQIQSLPLWKKIYKGAMSCHHVYQIIKCFINLIVAFWFIQPTKFLGPSEFWN